MVLKLSKLEIGYKGGDVLCRDINAEACGGEAVALIGSNGQGKSTLLRTMALLIKSKGGEVLLDGKSLESMPMSQRAKILSFVSTQRVDIAYTTVRQIVELGRVPYSSWAGKLSGRDDEIVENAMRETDTLQLAARTIDTLSDGQRQRVMIARALAQATPLIFLDEPTAFLDPKNRVKVIEMLGELARKTNKIIVYSTHEVDLCCSRASQIWQLEDGKFSVMKGDLV